MRNFRAANAKRQIFVLFAVLIFASSGFAQNMFRKINDFDGDGKTDLAIYRRGAQGFYWINGSQSGIRVFQWGTTNDFAVAY